MAKFFRFRLRTFLLFVALVGCFGGWLVGHEYAHRVELRVIEEVVGDRVQPSTRRLWHENAKYKLGVGIYDDRILG